VWIRGGKCFALSTGKTGQARFARVSFLRRLKAQGFDGLPASARRSRAEDDASLVE